MPVTTTAQLDALILLAKAVRVEGNHCHWDTPGIKAAIANVRHRSLADVTLAVIRAADMADLDTPGAIGNPTTSCWSERKTERSKLEPYDPSTFCGTCSQPRHRCESNPHSGHEFQSGIDDTRNRPTNVQHHLALARQLQADQDQHYEIGETR